MINAIPDSPPFLVKKLRKRWNTKLIYRTITGNGTLTQGNKVINGNFNIKCLTNGKLDIHFTGPGLPFTVNSTRNTRKGYGVFNNYSFRGNSVDGYQFQSKQAVIISTSFSNNGISYSLSAKDLSVKKTNYKSISPYKIIFSISNFIFMGTSSTKLKTGTEIKIDRNLMSILIDNKYYHFFYDPNINTIKKTLIEQNKSLITSWVEVNVNTKKEIPIVSEALGNILEMISAVTNQNINWIYYQIYDSKNKLIFENYPSRLQKHYKTNTLEVIDNYHPQGGLVNFVQLTYKNYSSLRNSYNLPKFIGYLNSVPSDSSIETFLLHIIPGIELLSNMIMLNSTDMRFRLNQSQLNTMNIEEKLNRLYPFYNYFSIKKWRKVRKDIVRKIRHPLFHSGLVNLGIGISFGKARFLHLIALQFFLKLIGYRGKYMDFTSQYNRTTRLRNM